MSDEFCDANLDSYVADNLTFVFEIAKTSGAVIGGATRWRVPFAHRACEGAPVGS